ncbi:proto-oncogene Mas-like [Paroedura picta]|uniref:proto-oncogene Mas-like n=1 Tax=Paroedura picta TaxID=143630 RepID=UPI0040570E69
MGGVSGNSNNSNFPNHCFSNFNYNFAEYILRYNPDSAGKDIIIDVLFSIVLVISFFGVMENGIVIWFLGFRIKRNPFMTYILNLAVADFGVLQSAMFYSIARYFLNICIFFSYVHLLALNLLFFLSLFMSCASQSLLTALSIDRCVAVFFPLWYRCKRPRHLSTIVCALMWVHSLLCTIIIILLYLLSNVTPATEQYWIMVNASLYLSVTSLVLVSLLVKVCLKAQQRQRGRILTIVLLALFFFLLFVLPCDVISILYILYDHPEYIHWGIFLLACLNSSVNPVIYFLVGRQWKSRRRENMKMILQKVFKEEEDCSEETEGETQE